MEEWVARHLPADEYLFAWRVGPTVICGRNQDVPLEVNLDYCRQHGIEVWRRKSGGGAVYADHNNLMISYVTPSTEVEPTFRGYSEWLAALLRSYGLNAEASGRNDVLIDGRKVSGGAFYKLPDRAIVHSTLLFSTDMEHMGGALTPSRAKLESKKVTSVQSRITTIGEHLPNLTIEEVEHRLASECDGRYELTPADIAEVEAICAGYEQQGGTPTPTPRDNRLFCQRNDAGEFRFSLGENGRLSAKGDFFPLCDLDAALAEACCGADLLDTLERMGVARAVAGIDNAKLAVLTDRAIKELKSENNINI
ncbi:MAG: lipoyltransferase [Muribaculaceae bacterium]|nr:lipoyltransferase [Muribaculaceae bacterium]